MMTMNKMTPREEAIAQESIRDFKLISGNRGNFESQWNEIAQRVIPAHANSFAVGQMGNNSDGAKNTEFLFDSTASVALGRFAAIVESLLNPKNQTWHRLKASDPVLNKDRATKLWFEEVNRTLFKYRYAPKANYASQNQKNYVSLGAYGTGAVFIDELKERNRPSRGMRYRQVHLGEIYFTENHQGIVDHAIRHFALTARQAVQKFGHTGRLPDAIVHASKNSPDRKYFFLHCIKVREDRDENRIDALGMEFGAYYISMEGQVLLEEGGFSTFPYAISRYMQELSEVYGRSPAMSVLPAIKTLNEEKKTVLKQGHRSVDPVLLAHDDGILDTFSLRPGAINAGGVSAEGRALVHALPVGNIAIGKELMDDERADIKDAFLNTLFQILVETPTMTATEVMERAREKGMLIAPTLGLIQSEYLGSKIDRELDILSHQGLLPPMPPLLVEAAGEYKIDWEGPLARAQRAEEAAGIMRVMESAMAVVNVTGSPEVMDHFNFDVIIPELAEIHGVPVRFLRGMEEIQATREGRAEAAKEQQDVAAAPAAAAMIKAGAVAKKTATG